MSEGTTKSTDSSKRKELGRTYESPDEIERRISEAGYGNIKIGRVASIHGMQFEVSEDREKNMNGEKNTGRSDFLRVGNPKKKSFNPVELARDAMVGKLGERTEKNKQKSVSRKKEDSSKEKMDRNTDTEIDK